MARARVTRTWRNSPVALAALISLLALAMPAVAMPGHIYAGAAPADARSRSTPHDGRAASIWFAPLDPTHREHPYDGSKDFMQLFQPGAPWKDAAAQVDVFKLYGGWVARIASDAQLRSAVANIHARGMRLAFEGGPLNPTATCGSGIEGFPYGLQEGPDIAQRIRSVGGVVDDVAMDEPFFYANVYDGPRACHWSPVTIARKVSKFEGAIHGVFPAARVGDIEPLVSGVPVSRYERWIDAYRKVTGHQLHFFHVDVDWARLDWPEAVKELEDFCKARNIEFGVIYNGDAGASSDRGWTTAAQRRFSMYEAQAGGRPDDAIFQSWNDHPDHALPETKAYTFTWLIDRYTRARTALVLNVTGSPASWQASGRLRVRKGDPIEGAPIRLTATPTSGSGIADVYTVRGTVPKGATHADVGYRVNTECGCDGSADLSLYAIEYRQGTGANRVPNASFTSALTGWGLWGEASQHLEPSDHGGGSMLHVTAAQGEVAAINSADFDVEAGKRFRVTFDVRVAPSSVGSGYLSLVFLGPSKEVLRERVFLEPATIELGDATTGADGRYATSGSGLPSGSLRIDAWYAGSVRDFPSHANRPL